MPNFHDYCRMQCTDASLVATGQGVASDGSQRICVGLKGDVIDTELPTKRHWISLSDDVACKLHRELSVYLPAWNRYLILFGGLYVDGAVDLVQAQTKARAWSLTPAVAQLIAHLVRSSDPNDPVLLAELQKNVRITERPPSEIPTIRCSWPSCRKTFG